MFQNKKYITRGVMNDIPPETQIVLWSLIDDWIQEGRELDYLQIFDLYPSANDHEGRAQAITHRQEQPKCEREHVSVTSHPVSAKVYVIDDTTHCTMLLAEEYQ